jgi:Ca2+-binding EF-hand superfamily protein
MIRTRRIASASFLLAATLAQPVVGEQSAGMDFKALDQDQNGFISEQEAQGNTALIEVWSASDSNQDGQIDMVEFSTMEISAE